jgi:hypothetical protein
MDSIIYSRVTFLVIPYAEALAGIIKMKLCKRVLKMENIETLWNTKAVEDKSYRYYNK